MLEFYYSEDKGLLDRKAQEFKSKHPSCRTLRTPGISDLQTAFFQRTVSNPTKFFIVDSYKDSTEELEFLLSNIGTDIYDIIFLNSEKKNIKLPNGLEEVHIPALDERTKKGYLNTLIKENKLKLSKDMIDQIKKSISPSALIINDLISKLSSLNLKNLSQEKLQELIDDPRREINYFSFFSAYIREEEYSWLEFINKNVNSITSFQKLFHSFIHKLLEFKFFLDLRHKNNDLKEIATSLKTKSFFLHDYEKFWKQHGHKIIQWVNKLIIDLFFLQRDLNKSFQINIELVKYFLLKTKLRLAQCQN